MKLISLVIPAYNAEPFLQWTLDSVEQQTYKNFECIIVNDGSKDATEAIIQKQLRKDSRFRGVFHSANSGLSAARNSGLLAANGEYIAFLDADDLLMRNSLAVRGAVCEKFKDENFIGAYCGSVGIPHDAERAPEATPWTGVPRIDFLSSATQCPFNANQPMFIREKLLGTGGFDETLKQAEDFEYWIRLMRSGFYWRVANMNCVTYRATEGSMIKRNPLLHLNTSIEIMDACYSELPVEFPNRSSKYAYTKSWSTYKHQYEMALRTLRFSGMSVAAGDGVEIAAQTVAKGVPDVFGPLADIFKPSMEMVKGAQRQIPGFDPKDPKNADLASKLDEAVSLAEKYSRKNKVEKPNTINEIQINPDGVSKRLSNRYWSLSAGQDVDILFFPHKDYHVREITRAINQQELGDVKSAICDISAMYRDEGVRRQCIEDGHELLSYAYFRLAKLRPKVLVVFNDWDPILRSILLAAQLAGIQTVSIVEGIQDYFDYDTKQDRGAYRVTNHVLLPGDFDEKYFEESDQKVQVVGMPRIFDLASKATPAPKRVKKVLINSNFSYGVLIEHRDQWVADAVTACQECGLEVEISRHPADHGKLYEELKTKDNFYDATENADLVIQRFASGVLEALAMKRHVIYFNPHNEQVDKFTRPRGAYPVISSKTHLVDSLNQLSTTAKFPTKAVTRFLADHCGLNDAKPHRRIASALNNIANVAARNGPANWDRFHDLLSAADQSFCTLTQVKKLREAGKTARLKAPFGSLRFAQAFYDSFASVISASERPTLSTTASAQANGRLSDNNLTYENRLAKGEIAFVVSQLPKTTGEIIGAVVSAKAGDHKPGFLNYGPYIDLKSGEYVLIFEYSSEAPEIKTVGQLDIVTDAGQDVHYEEVLRGTSSKAKSSKYKFKLQHDVHGLEIRTFFAGVGDLSIHSLTLEHVDLASN